ncbi:MAG: hypothetical protein B6D79_09210, partial [gamma proteobacterium symbiont of Ctena orbiculata]
NHCQITWRHTLEDGDVLNHNRIIYSLNTLYDFNRKNSTYQVEIDVSSSKTGDDGLTNPENAE